MTAIMECATEQKQDYRQIWSLVCSDLANYYGESLYRCWFSKIIFSELSDSECIILFSPTNFIRDWIKSSYLNVILKYLQNYDYNIKSVDIITKELPFVEKQLNTGNTGGIGESFPQSFGINTGSTSSIGESFPQSFGVNTDNTYLPLDERLTFENFVVGPSNELAYAAARAVAESKSAILESNPLFLYGGVGLGKTHLMNAIGWHVKRTNPGRKVLYMSAEKFMYTFIRALRNKDVMTFKDTFRKVDILMIDDIQFICGKDSTQEEFFHTFNAIIDNNRQMVISCDRSPADLDNVEDRIKSRLGWGLVADVHSTTYELRLGILQSKVEQMNVAVPLNVLEFLADKITSNVRELEGALNKVLAHSKLINKEINLPTTQNILRDLLKANQKMITIDTIQKRVADHYKIKLADMSSSCRNRIFARSRQVAMFISKKLTTKSLVDIGSKFGNKDHTTVIHAIRTVERLKLEDKDFAEEVNMLENSL